MLCYAMLCYAMLCLVSCGSVCCRVAFYVSFVCDSWQLRNELEG